MKYDLLKDIKIFSPKDIPKDKHILGNLLKKKTKILATFNPGLTRLKNKNLLMMVRIAEQLIDVETKTHVQAIRFDPKKKKFIIDKFPKSSLDKSDPRLFLIDYKNSSAKKKAAILTSMSYLLPVELTPDGLNIVKIHYNKVILPKKHFQQNGIEDARITKINNKYFMTTVGVSYDRLGSVLYSSKDGLNYKLEGLILDEQNKDALLFPKKIKNKYYMITRPMGDFMFASPPSSPNLPGFSMKIAESKDSHYWKPYGKVLIQPTKNSKTSERTGGGAPPILTKKGFLTLFHGVEPTKKNIYGFYKTFKALVDKNNPDKLKEIDYNHPVLESNPELTKDLKEISYMDNIVFTTGIVEHNDNYIIASGQDDLICRITHISKKQLEF
jgi:beta-1,2-mannobiose phosphorylase / 1,2-beta-oligomannan phosphorylase